MKMPVPDHYVPALRFRWLTQCYDPVIALTVRERTFKQQLITQATLSNHHALLDVGCGTGSLAIWVKDRYPLAEVYALDGDNKILSIARHKAQQANTLIQFDEGYAEALPYRDETFDRVVSSLFFHHLLRPQKQNTLMEILRVLKPGGECHIADWGKPTNRLMRLLFYSIQLLDGFATTRDHVDGLLPVLINDSGFENVTEHPEIQTLFGTLSLISACKPEQGNDQRG